VLEQTDLSSAKLEEANLTGAQLKGTILLDADLKKTDLRGAFLTGAILRGALGLTAEQVCSAANWRGALMDPQFRQEAESRCGATR